MTLQRAALTLVLIWVVAGGPLTARPAAAVAYYCNGLLATHVGTDAGETITGTAENDVIVAFGGDDTIYGGDDTDTICAGPGADTVYGEGGNDLIYGAAGADWLDGGYETPAAGDGDDIIDGGPNDDHLAGALGNDVLRGGDGIDHLFGGTGHDWLEGGEGDDTIFGEDGNDYLTGNDDADTLEGGPGLDLLDEANDYSAVNTLSGGNDADTLIGGEEGDSLSGGQGNDQLDGKGELLGGRGNDELIARATGVTCEGGAGTDTLIGTLFEPAPDSCLSTADIEVIGGLNDPLVATGYGGTYVRRLPGDHLFVMLNVTGLEPSRAYPWRIHDGVGFDCSGGDPLPNGQEMQSYPDLVTDASGNAFLAVTLDGDLFVDRVASAGTEVGYGIKLFDAPSVPAPDDPVGPEVRCVGPLSRTPLPHPSQSSHGW